MTMTEVEQRCVNAGREARNRAMFTNDDISMSSIVRAVLAEAGVAEMQARITKLEEALYACRRAVAGRQDDPRRKVRAIVIGAFGGDPNDAWPKDYEEPPQ